jgi:iron complex outermembrane receptor protein
LPRPGTGLTWTSGARVVEDKDKGKQVTDTPEILLKSELTYDNGAFFASANVNYTDERFYTYLNQGSVNALPR